MRREFLAQLEALDRATRIRAWMNLHLEPNVSDGLTRADRTQLGEKLRDEKVEEILRLGLAKIIELGFNMGPAREATAATGVKPEILAAATLKDVIWKSFQKESCLLSISERVYRRDEDALAILARCVSYDDFPNTKLQSLPLGDERWARLFLNGSYKTVLVLGRPGLLGTKAAKRLIGTNLRLSFPLGARPTGLERGKLHPEYHKVCETLPDGTQQCYQAVEKKKVRTDYGIVQVYPVYIDGARITIVQCAGCSSLGTLGAAQWLAHELRVHPIPVAEGMNPESRIEALVVVKADTTTCPWEVLEIRLRRLRVDDWEWSTTERRWIDQRKHEVTVVLGAEGPRQLLIDGKPSTLRPGSDNFDAVARLALETKKNGGQPVARSVLIPLHTPAGHAIDETSDARRIVSYLKTGPLKGMFKVEGREVRLLADVKVISEGRQRPATLGRKKPR